MKKTIFFLLGTVPILLFTLSSTAPLYAESAGETMELKLATWNPPQILLSQVMKQWGEKIEERSNGRIKITFYFAQSLASYRDTYRVTQSGVADIGNWVFGILSGLHPLNEIMSLPLMGWDSMETSTKVYHELREKYPQLDAESKGMKLLWAESMPAYSFHLTKKEVRVPNDVRGMKLIAGGAWTDFAKALGFVSVDKGPPDWYMSLQKGLAEGQYIHWPAAYSFKIIELCSSHTLAGDAGFGMQMQCMFMNMKTWNELPPDIQKIFMDLQPWVQKEIIKIDTQLTENAMAEAEKAGHKMNHLTKQEIELWTQATAPVREKWISSQEAKGNPAKAIYDDAKRLIAKYNK
jgi:TRAP-type C4-dicarboxylate transport system substrate-binding protein